MLSFFLYIFFFCITRTFHKCQNWGSAKWFFSTSNFLFGGMYLSNIHWHLKPIQIFPGVWRNMGQLYFMWFWRIFFWINSCSNTDEKCQIDMFVFVAFSGKDNWMGCKSRHFSASEILSIIYFQKRSTMTQKCDLQEISQHVTVKCIYTLFFFKQQMPKSSDDFMN